MTSRARGIELPVGRDGQNKSEDVRIIQQLLNEAREREKKLQSAGIKTLKVDGECGPLTIRAIQNYQEKALGWSGKVVDATVHPGGKTWKSLNGNILKGIKVATVTTRPKTIIDGYTAFRQGDKAWGPEILGNGNHTIHQWGCAMCTLTMAATAIGSPTN